MVSEAVYKFFQTLHDEETKRFAEHESRARLYFSIASLYVGAIAFKFEDVVRLFASVRMPSFLIAADGALFVVAILFCVLAMQKRNYEAIAAVEEVLAELQSESGLSDEQFFEYRLIDYSVATRRNADVNRRVATWLAVAGFSVLAGVAGQVLLFVYIVIQQIKG